MTREELIEVMAQAMLEDELSVDPHSDFATVWANESDIWLSNARAALAAIEASGVRLVPELVAENKRLAGLIRVLLENEPHDAVSDGGHTVLDLWRHDARAALKEPGQ